MAKSNIKKIAQQRKSTTKKNGDYDYDYEYENESNIINVNCGGQTSEQRECNRKCCPKCCYFDIYMSRVRATSNNDGYSECMLTGYANGYTATFPGMGSWFIIHKRWGWRNINKFIVRVCMEQGKTQGTVSVTADAIEVDRWLGGNWECGSSEVSKILTLQCGQVSEPQIIKVECKKVKNAQAGVVTSVFEVEFIAYPVNNCCCC